MSHLTHLLADIRRSPRKAQPFDQMSKAQMWARLQAAEAALNASANAAQWAATAAHNYAQGLTGEPRRQMLAVRDAVEKARDKARGAAPGSINLADWDCCDEHCTTFPKGDVCPQCEVRS